MVTQLKRASRKCKALLTKLRLDFFYKPHRLQELPELEENQTSLDHRRSVRLDELSYLNVYILNSARIHTDRADSVAVIDHQNRLVSGASRKRPRPEEPIEFEPQIRVVCSVGGLILFSGAQLYWTVPNTSGRTRFSIDFRTVHIDDVIAKGGAPNLDSAPQGTTLRELMRVSDLAHIPQEVIALYEPPTSGDLVFQPPDLSTASR